MIKSFKLFESYNEIKSICDMYDIQNWELNSDTGRVDVRGDVNISGRGLKKLPLKFGRVDGNFYCYNNQLTSLEGGPNSVGGNFYCYSNQLTTLEGGPNSVGRDFYCYSNKLTSLEGSPNSVGRDFYCYDNQLTTLEGSPSSVGRGFYCNDNQLTTLEGGPNSVGGNFNCSHNKLTSLEGGPNSVGGNFSCHSNQITDFKVPEYSLNENRKFRCEGNPIWEIYDLFNSPKCIDLINEYGAVGGGKVSRLRLEEVFLEMGMEIPKNLRFKNWELV